MAIHLRKSKLFDDNIGILNEKTVHYLPCKINQDGPANVSKYFSNLITSNGNGLKASFRGYPLNGQVIVLPADYKGLVLRELTEPVNGGDRTFHITNTFDRLTYWNWDKIPCKDDAFISALDWIDISDAIHSPIEDKSDSSVAD